LDKSRPGELDEIRIANSVLDSLIEHAKPGSLGQTFEFDDQQLNSFLESAQASRSDTKTPTVWLDGDRVRDFADVTMVRLHQIGFIQDFSIEGFGRSQSFTVDFSEYSLESLKAATLQALDDLNIGRHSENESLIRQLPDSVESLLRGAVRLLIEAIYAVIMPARMTGIAELIRIATGPMERMGTDMAAYMDGGEIREQLSELLDSLIGSDSTPAQLRRLIEGFPPGTQAQWRGQAISMLVGAAVEIAAFRAFRAIAEWVSPDADPNYAMDEFIGALNRWPGQEAELAIELAALAESGTVSGSGMASGVLGAWIRKHALSTPAPDQLVSAVEAEGGMGIEYRIATNAHKLLEQLRAVAV
jgi:hypothetical protein